MALAVDGNNSLKPGPGLGTHSHPSITFNEAASQTFVKGCPVVFTSGGSTIEQDTTDPAPIVGITAEAASGTTNDPVRVYPAIPGLLFEGILGNGDLTDNDLDATDVGDVYGLAYDSTNFGWFVDKQDIAVATVRVRVMGLKDAAGTTNGRVYFSFLTVTQDNDATPTPLIPVTIFGYAAAA
jgi:hypothetical protein